MALASPPFSYSNILFHFILEIVAIGRAAFYDESSSYINDIISVCSFLFSLRFLAIPPFLVFDVSGALLTKWKSYHT